jgi:acetyl-CoA acetyltransferase
MPEAVLVSALRTPIGTAFKGSLRDTTAFDLADHVVGAAAEGLDPDLIDDVILGEGLYGGGVIARHAAITAGLTSVPGLAQNRHCAAGLAAVQGAAASVRSGMDELIIAGGSTRRPPPPGPGCGPTGSGPTGSRRPTRTGRTRPTWTCPSRWAGTRPSRRV